MSQKTIMEIFCEGCPHYKPDWDREPTDAGAMPCKLDYICRGNAKKMALVEDDE